MEVVQESGWCDVKHLRLDRHAQNSFATYGNIIDLATSKELVVTLERPWVGNAKGISCVPVGEYVFTRYRSPKRGYDVFITQGVRGRSDIELHIGNGPQDSEGCILLGSRFVRSPEGRIMAESKKAFEKFMVYLAGEDSFTLTIEDHSQDGPTNAEGDE